jgi:hypothetical protein
MGYAIRAGAFPVPRERMVLLHVSSVIMAATIPVGPRLGVISKRYGFARLFHGGRESSGWWRRIVLC